MVNKERICDKWRRPRSAKLFFLFFQLWETFVIEKEMKISFTTDLDSMRAWYFTFKNLYQWTLPIIVHTGLVRIRFPLPLSDLAR